MPQLGVPELVLILVIVIAVFGAGKLANIGGALGKGVKDFRSSIRDESKPEAEEIVATPKAVVTSQPVAPQVVANPEPTTPETGEGQQSA
ncbi:MAG: twin-arginine translocase TatA/TatE family subunit [Anaerolineae bacterium]|jgi:sec-independent protein translocase protein TatA